MASRSLYDHGFVRVAACTSAGRVGDPQANAEAILASWQACHEDGAALAVFPELALSSYAIDDLLMQDALLDAVAAASDRLVEASRGLRPLLLVGAPVFWRHRRSTIAPWRSATAVCSASCPRSTCRTIASSTSIGSSPPARLCRVGPPGSVRTRRPSASNLLFEASDLPGFVVHAEICEDLWVPAPPSSLGALAGATVLANLSASNITVGKAETRHLLTRSQSARCLAAYVYAAAGTGESTTDLAWDGQVTIDENGVNLATSERFPRGAQHVVADVDLDLLRQERLRQGTFDDNAGFLGGAEFRRVPFAVDPPAGAIPLRRRVERFPFVPADPARLGQDCFEAYGIQVSGLEQRLGAIGVKRVVIGVSGGLDSTQALIVAARAFDRLALPRKDILAYTLPGFATGDDTKANAHALMAALGVTASEIDIRPAARQMLGDMAHPFAAGEKVYDVTFENVQAGLRTDYLFRLANQHAAIVLGTGDLSELALGWCTYGVGDQMSHYNVNGGVPKTLIQHLIRWVADTGLFSRETGDVLRRILATEISPELVPVEHGAPPQSTQETIGPYELQDFALYYVLRYGFRPSKIAFLAEHAWGDVEAGAWPAGFPPERRRAYDAAAIRRWLELFVRRFFGFSQFKRSAMPNGPKVVAGGSLSPRGDWRAPSDGTATAWLAELRDGD